MRGVRFGEPGFRILQCRLLRVCTGNMGCVWAKITAFGKMAHSANKKQPGHENAIEKIRKVAAKICRILQREAPNVFGDYTLKELPDGTLAASTEYRKV